MRPTFEDSYHQRVLANENAEMKRIMDEHDRQKALPKPETPHLPRDFDDWVDSIGGTHDPDFQYPIG